MREPERKYSSTNRKEVEKTKTNSARGGTQNKSTNLSSCLFTTGDTRFMEEISHHPIWGLRYQKKTRLFLGEEVE